MKLQEIEELRAIYSAGRFELPVTHKKFSIDTALWHLWSEKRKMSYIEVFRSYIPSLGDKFKRPKLVCRKPSQTFISPSVIPDKIEDRHKNLSTKPSSTEVPHASNSQPKSSLQKNQITACSQPNQQPILQPDRHSTS